MRSQKKERPEAATSKRSVQGFRREQQHGYYSMFRSEMQALSERG